MAKQTIPGPYRVKRTDTGYEVVELVGEKSVSLRPARRYPPEKRTFAYQQMVRMNRHLQRSSSIAPQS